MTAGEYICEKIMGRKYPRHFKSVSKHTLYELLTRLKATALVTLGFKEAVKLENGEMKITCEFPDTKMRLLLGDEGYEGVVFYIQGHDYMTQLGIAMMKDLRKKVEELKEEIYMKFVRRKEGKNKQFSYFLRFEEGQKPEAKIKRCFLIEDYDYEPTGDYEFEDMLYKVGVVDKDGDVLLQEDDDERI